jgi:SAM-dependent methyltransferase
MKSGESQARATPANEYYEQARNYIRQGRLDEAYVWLEKSVAAGKNAPAFHDIGIIWSTRGDAAQALKFLQESIACDNNFHQAYANIARILFENGEPARAFPYAGQALLLDPQNADYKSDFSILVKNAKITDFSPDLKRLVALCLEKDDVDHQNLAKVWYSLLVRDPGMKLISDLVQQKNYDEFKKKISEKGDHGIFCDPYFLGGLQKLLVPAIEFEQFLTRLRRVLLERISSPKSTKLSISDGQAVALAASLAMYAFNTQYIFSAAGDEDDAMMALWTKVTTDLAKGNADAASAAVLACYMPLYKLKDAAGISDKISVLPGYLIREQVTEPLLEREIAQSIETVTKIENETSGKVRAQYEESPYPRWRYVSPYVAFDGIEDLNREGAEMLVAGCGTGREAIELAKGFPKAKVVAVDLSRASLSYATRKAREAGITNVTFRQGDILELGTLNLNFDLVSSQGVLHHLAEPEKGWRVLAGLVKSGGFMRIALYSEAGRQAVVAARKVIADKEYGSGPDEIRRFRQDAPRLLKPADYEDLLRYLDYFNMPECRDLLFHVMEHRFTIPQLRNALDRLGLQFMRFIIPSNDYQGIAPGDLAAWEKFEKQNPDAFKFMYNFWCRKAA